MDPANWAITNTAPPVSQPSALVGGFKSGILGLSSDLAGGVAAVSRYAGATDFAKRATASADDLAAQSANVRPDLEKAPWEAGGAHALPYLVYQGAKMAPTLLGLAAAPELGAERLGAAAAKSLGAAAVALPFAAGQNYNAAGQKEGGATDEDTARALVLAPVTAAINTFAPGLLMGGIGGHLITGIADKIAVKGVGGFLARAGAGALVDGAAGAVQGGAATALTQEAFRPDLSAQEKMDNIVQATATGAALGGLAGGVIGGFKGSAPPDPVKLRRDAITERARGIRNMDATDVTQDHLTDFIDTVTSSAPPTESVAPAQEQVAPVQAQAAEPSPMSRLSDAELQDTYGKTYDYLARNLGDKEPSEYTPEEQQLVAAHAEISDELARRKDNGSVTAPGVDNKAVGAVEQLSDVSGGVEPNSTAASAPTLFSLDDALKGISTKKNYSDAVSEDELRTRVTQRLEDGSTAKGDLVLAERLGIDLGKPAEAAAPVEVARAAEPNDLLRGVDKMPEKIDAALTAVSESTPEPKSTANKRGGDQTLDVDFRTKLRDDIAPESGSPKFSGELVKQLVQADPRNRADAEHVIMDLLSDDHRPSDGSAPGETSFKGSSMDGYNSMLKLAEKYDLYKDGQLTDRGLEVARAQMPDNLIQAAAGEKGHSSSSEAFAKGARGEEPKGLTNDDALAYKAGEQWALDRSKPDSPIPYVEGDNRTDQIVKKITPEEVAKGLVDSKVSRVTMDRMPNESEQTQQKLNAEIDAVHGDGLKNPEVAQLKRMVADGGTRQDVADAAAKFRAGETPLAFEPPARAIERNRTASGGALPDRTQIFRAKMASEADIRAKQELAARATKRRNSKSEDQRAIDDHKAYKDQLVRAIDEMHADGSLTNKERGALLFKVTTNDFKSIETRLSQNRDGSINGGNQFLRKVAEIAASNLPHGGIASKIVAPPSKESSPALRRKLTVGDTRGALALIQRNSDNPINRIIASKLLRSNWDNVDLQTERDDGTFIRGTTSLEDNGRSTITLNGVDGMREETVLHEMIHAYVQQRWASVGIYTEPGAREALGDKTNRSDKAIQDFHAIWTKVTAAVTRTDPQLARDAAFGREMQADPDEMLSWVLTNGDAQRYLRAIDIDGNKISGAAQPSMWSKVVDYVRGLLGLPDNPKMRTALDHVMDAGLGILDKGAGVTSNDFTVKVANQLAKNGGRINQAMDATKTTDNFKRSLGEIAEKGDEFVKSLPTKVRAKELYLGGDHTIQELYAPTMQRGDRNGLMERNQHNDQRAPMANLVARPANEVSDRVRALERADPKAVKLVNEIMLRAYDGMHPMRTWAEQSPDVKSNPLNKPVHAELVDYMNQLRRSDFKNKNTNGVDLYNAIDKVSKVERIRDADDILHKIVENTPLSAGKMAEFGVHSMDDLLDRSTRETFGIDNSFKYWNDKFVSKLTALETFVKDQTALADHPGTSNEDRAAIRADLGRLTDAITSADKGYKKLDQGPNFSLGHVGDYFVAMKLKLNEDGSPDRKALAKVADHLAEFGAVVPLNNNNDKIFMRVETQAQHASLINKAMEMQAAGHLQPDEGTDKGTAIQIGKRGDVAAASVARDISPFLESYEASLRSNKSYGEKTVDQLMSEMRSHMLDRMPDNSMAKFMAPRKSIGGFDSDMVGSFLRRTKAANDSMVGRVTSPKIADSYNQMETRLKEMQLNPKGNKAEDIYSVRDVIDEMRKRDKIRGDYTQTPVKDALRRIVNFASLGFTVAYPIIQLTQLGMVALPKLGSIHGFVKSASAMGRNTSEAFKITKAIIAEGYDAPDLSTSQRLARASNVEVSLESLKRAGIDSRKAEYLMHLVNSGQLGTGSQAHLLTAAAHGETDGAFNHTMQLASGMGYYAETLTRVLTALTHLDLAGPDISPKDASVGGIKMLKDSLFEFQADAQGRAFGKDGIYGKMTPLMTQFMTYQSQLIQRLYLEAHTSFVDKAATPEAKSQARAFLMQHAAMTTMFAGTLGLPFATAFAAAYDKIKELMDPEDGPSDIRSSYRDYLASIVGKDAGELIAKGGFRALGVDMTGRIGEQDVLPFSKFLADRRAIKDQLKDLESRSWGAPIGLASNAIQGVSKMADGDVLAGMQMMMPAIIANGVKAYRMENGGYVDANGRQLPIAKPSATATMAQLLGFTPAAKAEYSDASMAQSQRRAQLTEESKILTNQIVAAHESGDHDGLSSAIADAREFDKTNQAFAVLPRMGSAIGNRVKNKAEAQATHTPLGVKIEDVKGRSLTQYANY